MKLKELKSILQSFDVFKRPNIALEQYATCPDTAANLLNVANSEFDDIEGKLVADLGCGCGVLCIGASLLDAGFCIGFDIDVAALKISEKNREKANCDNIDFVQCDVQNLENSRWHKMFDTVIMNPPFGTKNNKGIDLEFLRIALSLAKTAVFSLHKSSTVDHIKKVAEILNVKMECLYKLKYELPKSYGRHKRKSVDIDVHLIRFSFE